jgi:hypothetical protein
VISLHVLIMQSEFPIKLFETSWPFYPRYDDTGNCNLKI